MNNFIFQNATKVYFGQGCVKEYLACLTKNADTVLLAYGGGSIKRSGIYDEVVGILQNAGKTIVEFDHIMSNPTYAKVQEGAKLARESGADMILAVGGGSVMDCCKAVSLAARYEGDIWEDFWARPGVIEVEPLPLGVIVTVAGTGSECNGGAVITNEEKKIKTGRDYPKLNPRFALMDPTYTYSVPKGQMVSGSFDILSHIMETYFSEPNEDNVSDDIMEALMKSVIRNLRAAIQNPKDYTARSNLMWDSIRHYHHAGRICRRSSSCSIDGRSICRKRGLYKPGGPGEGKLHCFRGPQGRAGLFLSHSREKGASRRPCHRSGNRAGRSGVSFLSSKVGHFVLICRKHPAGLCPAAAKAAKQLCNSKADGRRRGSGELVLFTGGSD